jgi:hypothetical protein
MFILKHFKNKLFLQLIINKQLQNYVIFTALFTAIFALFIHVNSNIYLNELKDIYNNVTQNNLHLQENYINSLRYNLNLQVNAELINDKCNYSAVKGPRIICAVFTIRKSHGTKLKAVHDTWSKRSIL